MLATCPAAYDYHINSFPNEVVHRKIVGSSSAKLPKVVAGRGRLGGGVCPKESHRSCSGSRSSRRGERRTRRGTIRRSCGWTCGGNRCWYSTGTEGWDRARVRSRILGWNSGRARSRQRRWISRGSAVGVAVGAAAL
jgi:hypothetical protein